MKKLTKLEHLTFNNLCMYRASHNRRSPSPWELKIYMHSAAGRDPIRKRLLNIAKKGYLTHDEQGKFIPTRDGISQAIQDWSEPVKRLKRNKGITGYDSYKAEILPSEKRSAGKLR